MINENSFVLMLDKFQKNLEELYKNAGRNSHTTVEESRGLLSVAYKELGTASEELQIALEELTVKSEELATTQMKLEAERQHYKAVFELLPDAYVISNLEGKILQANQACATLLNVESRFLSNKPIDIFLPPQERQLLVTKLSQLHHSGQSQHWVTRIQPRNAELLEIAISVAHRYDRGGKLVALHWILREQTQHQQVHCWPVKNNGSLSQETSKYIYQQGEIIPLHPNSLWIVHQGWVKLSTLAESGEEILIGLVGESMPFGSSLTSLPTYQATALSQKVQLSCVPLAQVVNSTEGIKMIFPQIIERLRQTEYLLAIGGVRQVNERVNQLLLWLKENFSQKTAQGYRLRVRLTHQELANACGTTRVTITRLLGQLKKQGKIIYDTKHHIIFLSEN
ncbi:helix-turn-helix domain-containing protein [Gloeothece verrucosa]|uniref:Transcriptional regulator, Crp/Fnr family n=1 Tax=Gloeothece verrucosa (strain PCC 7822) TaxID=497965 RepID=E0UGB2_GLOV7|nr:helix-turn-helix domain-containing protein [Gloeothece verrucosa]ADN16731.1 transcriptional regulator, Crp/Fnr family [Gloeothece verrucosa PCC 7822]